MKMKKTVILFVLSSLILAQAAVCADLGDIGATYPIAERDALAEIEGRAKAVDWGKAFDRKKTVEKIRNYRPEGMETLPPAREDRVFQADVSWTLDFDIPDGKGGILYPKGFSFNPLAYVFLPNILVVIDGDDKKQVEWFKASSYAKDYRVMLLLCGGSYTRVMEKLKRPAFYADARVVKRFQLKAVPAVIVQKGAVMEVREYALDDKGQKKRK
jgi:conjugal transfer pilus assembly protein TraW